MTHTAGKIGNVSIDPPGEGRGVLGNAMVALREKQWHYSMGWHRFDKPEMSRNTPWAELFHRARVFALCAKEILLRLSQLDRHNVLDYTMSSHLCAHHRLEFYRL